MFTRNICIEKDVLPNPVFSILFCLLLYFIVIYSLLLFATTNQTLKTIFSIYKYKIRPTEKVIKSSKKAMKSQKKFLNPAKKQ